MVCSIVAEFLCWCVWHLAVIIYSSELKDWSLQSMTDTKQHKRETLILKFYVSVVPEGKEHMQQENWEDICHGSQASIKLDNDYESITIDILHKAVGMGSFSHDRESNQHPTEVVPSHTHLLCASHQNMSLGNLNVIGMAEGDRQIMRFTCELFYSSPSN